MKMEGSLLLYMLESTNHEILKWKVDEAADLLRSFHYFSDPPVTPALTQAGPQESCEENQGGLKCPGGEQSLGIRRTPSQEATSWLKESLGMLASPRPRPPRCDDKENSVEMIEAEMMESIEKHDPVSVSQSVSATWGS